MDEVLARRDAAPVRGYIISIMETRHYTLSDRLIGEIDKAIRVLWVPARAARARPAAPAGELAPDEARRSARLMRVNHAGEVAAQALYQGQALTARSPETAAAMQHAAQEEADHLAWCERRIDELGGRTSLLNPLWYAGSWCLGALAGLIGDRTSLGFIAATEELVESHLHGHLERLPPGDAASRAILEQMKHDEAAHGATAARLGGYGLPGAVKSAMRATSRLMTQGSYWL